MRPATSLIGASKVERDVANAGIEVVIDRGGHVLRRANGPVALGRRAHVHVVARGELLGRFVEPLFVGV